MVLVNRPMLFSTKDGIISIIQSINPSKVKMTDPDMYHLWLYGKDLIPGSKDFNYYVGTNQTYLLKALSHNQGFQRLMSLYPGLKDLYNYAMRLIA